MNQLPQRLGEYSFKTGLSPELQQELTRISVITQQIRTQIEAALTQQSLRLLPDGFSWKREDTGLVLYYAASPAAKKPEHNPIFKRRGYGQIG